jgi:hypothetical protein
MSDISKWWTHDTRLAALLDHGVKMMLVNPARNQY